MHYNYVRIQSNLLCRMYPSSTIILVAFVILQNGVLAWKKYDFKIKYAWKQLEFTFASEAERSQAIQNGTFNVGKVQPIDAQYAYDKHTRRERIFITFPREDPSGYPATLGVVTDKTKNGNPIIDPYPSWSWNINPEKCNYHRIVSVFRVWVDECNRLWVIDNGMLGNNFSCTPQILAFDLKTDKLLYKYEIPYNQYNNISLFLTPMADVEDFPMCQNTWIYVADSLGPSLLVYSLKQNTSWQIKDRSFDANPDYYNYTVDGDTFSVNDGILALALSPRTDPPSKRKLHYHAMSDDRESWVYTKDLKNPENFQVPYNSPQFFHIYRDKRNQQSAAEGADRYGNLYFSLLIDIELVKWNPSEPYKREYFHVIGDNKKTMQFPSGLKVSPYKNGEREVLWVFTTAYQRTPAGTLNGSVTNFRLFFAEL